MQNVRKFNTNKKTVCFMSHLTLLSRGIIASIYIFAFFHSLTHTHTHTHNIILFLKQNINY